MARKGVAQKVRGRNLCESCAEGKKQDSAKETRWRKGQEGAERQDHAEEDEIVRKTKLCRRQQDRAEEDEILKKTTRSRGKEKPRGREKSREKEKKPRKRDSRAR